MPLFLYPPLSPKDVPFLCPAVSPPFQFKSTSSLRPSLISPHPNAVLPASSISLSLQRLLMDTPSAVQLLIACVCVCYVHVCVFSTILVCGVQGRIVHLPLLWHQRGF